MMEDKGSRDICARNRASQPTNYSNYAAEAETRLSGQFKNSKYCDGSKVYQRVESVAWDRVQEPEGCSG